LGAVRFVPFLDGVAPADGAHSVPL
jgi:hypothetical protein